MNTCWILAAGMGGPRYACFFGGKGNVTARITDATRFSREEDADDMASFLNALPIALRPTAFTLEPLRYEP